MSVLSQSSPNYSFVLILSSILLSSTIILFLSIALFLNTSRTFQPKCPLLPTLRFKHLKEIDENFEFTKRNFKRMQDRAYSR